MDDAADDDPATGVDNLSTSDSEMAVPTASLEQAFVEKVRAADPARAVGPNPTMQQLVLVEEYAASLEYRVLPAVRAELHALADEVSAALGTRPTVSVRAKDADGLIDKVVRMTAGRPGSPPRPSYRTGDVVDAVGARVAVSDMPVMAALLSMMESRWGVGDGGRILEIGNMYAESESEAPGYPVIPMTVSITVDGKPYAFAVTLTTERAAVAADGEDRQVWFFEHGEAYDDLRPAFYIDEISYSDSGHARSVVEAAKSALRRVGVIFEIEVAGGRAALSPGIPTWEEFKHRHFVEAVPHPARLEPDQAIATATAKAGPEHPDDLHRIGFRHATRVGRSSEDGHVDEA